MTEPAGPRRLMDRTFPVSSRRENIINIFWRNDFRERAWSRYYWNDNIIIIEI